MGLLEVLATARMVSQGSMAGVVVGGMHVGFGVGDLVCIQLDEPCALSVTQSLNL